MEFCAGAISPLGSIPLLKPAQAMIRLSIKDYGWIAFSALLATAVILAIVCALPDGLVTG